jgi:hypothetical protein
MDEEDRIGVDKASLHRRERREFSPQRIRQAYSSYSARLAELEEEEEEDFREINQENPPLKNDSQ